MTAAVIAWLVLAPFAGLAIGACLAWCDTCDHAVGDEPTDWDTHLSAWPSGDELIACDEPLYVPQEWWA